MDKIKFATRERLYRDRVQKSFDVLNFDFVLDGVEVEYIGVIVVKHLFALRAIKTSVVRYAIYARCRKHKKFVHDFVVGRHDHIGVA